MHHVTQVLLITYMYYVEWAGSKTGTCKLRQAAQMQPAPALPSAPGAYLKASSIIHIYLSICFKIRKVTKLNLNGKVGTN
jgi:hypothetical protein